MTSAAIKSHLFPSSRSSGPPQSTGWPRCFTSQSNVYLPASIRQAFSFMSAHNGSSVGLMEALPPRCDLQKPPSNQKKGKEIKTVLPFFQRCCETGFSASSFCILNNEIWPIKSLLTTNEQKLYSNSRKNSILKLLSAHFSFRSNFKITEFLFSILHKADMLGRPGCEMLSIKTS